MHFRSASAFGEADGHPSKLEPSKSFIFLTGKGQGQCTMTIVHNHRSHSFIQ